MTPLRKKMEADMRLRGLGPSTRGQYIGCVRRFAVHFGHSPSGMGTDHVRMFLLHLLELGRARATVVVYWAALLFLFRTTLGRPEVMKDVPRPRVPRRDPVPALTEAEVTALLDAAGRCRRRRVLRGPAPRRGK